MSKRVGVARGSEWAVAVGVFALGFLVVLGVAPSDSFPLHQDGDCDVRTDLDYEFDDGEVTWTTTRKNHFNQASDNWDIIDDADGDTITDVNEVASSTIKVYLLPNGESPTTDCQGAAPVIKVAAQPLAIDFKGATVHEVGHALGLDHTGQWDSYDDDETTMTGCATGGWDRWLTFEQDDAGQFLSNYGNDLHANPSFEDNANWTDDIWKVRGGATLQNRNGTSAIGTRHGEIEDGGYIYQDMQVADPGDMRTAAYVRKELASATGTVTLSHYARRINYTTILSGTCIDKWHNNWDFDEDPDNYASPTADGFYDLMYSKVITPTVSWPGSESETSPWREDTWEGVDVRVRIDNDLWWSGAPADADIDHVRARHLP